MLTALERSQSSHNFQQIFKYKERKFPPIAKFSPQIPKFPFQNFPTNTLCILAENEEFSKIVTKHG